MATKFIRRLANTHRSFFTQKIRFVGYSTNHGQPGLGCLSPKIRKFCVAGNWMMYGNKSSITELCKILGEADLDPAVDVVIACPAVYLEFTRSRLPQSIGVAAENAYKVRDKGAFTGEISPTMLSDLSIDWVILGHSERRIIFNETDELIAEKCRAALDEGLNIIACVGETLEERKCWESEEVVARQLWAMATKIKDWKNVVLAYEPVWAMDTENAATPKQIQEMLYFIRNWLTKKVSKDVSDKTRIQYGGPVTAGNCKMLTELHDLDGFLVGYPSLSAEFIDIVNCNGFIKS